MIQLITAKNVKLKNLSMMLTWTIDATICLLSVSYLLIFFWWYNKQETVSHEMELISYLTACKTHVGDKGLMFWNVTAAFPSLTPFTQGLLSAPASQAYVECVFSVCGHLTSGKRNRLCKKLANRAFLRMNTKFYNCIWVWLSTVYQRNVAVFRSESSSTLLYNNEEG